MNQVGFKRDGSSIDTYLYPDPEAAPRQIRYSRAERSHALPQIIQQTLAERDNPQYLASGTPLQTLRTHSLKSPCSPDSRGYLQLHSLLDWQIRQNKTTPQHLTLLDHHV